MKGLKMIVYPLYLDYKGACSAMLEMHIFKTKEDRDMFMKHIQNEYGDCILVCIPTNEYGTEIKATVCECLEELIAEYELK